MMDDDRWKGFPLQAPEEVSRVWRLRRGETCPYCGKTFYAPPLHDPLKHHIDYCAELPEEEEE